MPDLNIPPSVEHVTSQWLTAALRSTGVIDGSTVTSFDFEPMGAVQGFAGQVDNEAPPIRLTDSIKCN